MKHKFLIEVEINPRLTPTRIANIKYKLDKIDPSILSLLIHNAVIRNELEIKDGVTTKVYPLIPDE